MTTESTAIRDAAAAYTSAAVLEECHGSAIYGVAFNHYRQEENVFGAVGHNRATIYRCAGEGNFDLLQSYVDDDEGEEFYVCLWSMDVSNRRPLLLCAGKRGVVRVIDPRHNLLVNTLVGHGQAVNDLAIFPSTPHILLTASKDASVRVWNVKTGVTICLVSGEGGHTAEVISIDGHLSCLRFVTSGMDDCIKIWTLEAHSNVLQLAETWKPKEKQINFPTVHIEYPVFSTRSVHGNYVDCVKWYGDLIISKGVDERIVVFKPVEVPEDRFQTSEAFVTLLELRLSPCEVWFVRFSLDFEYTVLACGDQEGHLNVWDIRSPTEITHSVLSHPNCSTVIRQTAVSRDGSIILAACDSGEIWRWDIQPQT